MIGWIILGIVVVFLIVILVRAAAFKPAKISDPPKEEMPLDTTKCVEHLSSMVRVPTVSSYDWSKVDDSKFDEFRALLKKTYPNIYKTCSFERAGTTGILHKWAGKSDKAPVVLMAHYDVVPVVEDRWKHPPFCGEIFDGELWGRGTLDTKITLLGVMESAERLIGEGFVPANDVYMAFAGDEEVAGLGARAIIDVFKSRGIQPALVIDEGGAIVDKIFPGVSKPIAVIGIGEKGMVDAAITAHSAGGHASTPPAHSAVGIMSKAVVDCENHPFKANITLPVRKLFETVGPHSTFGIRLLFGNLWCFGWLVKALAPKLGGELNAMMRTTMAFTMAEGSKQINVLPGAATAGVNLRLINLDTTEQAVEHMKKAINNPDVEITLRDGMNASPYADPDGTNFKTIATAIRQTWGEDVIVSPYLMVACSDSRHYAGFCKDVFKFSAMALTKAQRGLIHNDDERIPVTEIAKTVEFYTRLLKLL